MVPRSPFEPHQMRLPNWLRYTLVVLSTLLAWTIVGMISMFGAAMFLAGKGTPTSGLLCLAGIVVYLVTVSKLVWKWAPAERTGRLIALWVSVFLNLVLMLSARNPMLEREVSRATLVVQSLVVVVLLLAYWYQWERSKASRRQAT